MTRQKRVHGDVGAVRPNAWHTVWQIVRAIPRGKVMTYGQISSLMGSVISPAAVGWAMHVCPDDVPWHRVVNASGGCSTERRGDMPPDSQRRMLEAEGVDFRLDGTLDLAVHRWSP